MSIWLFDLGNTRLKYVRLHESGVLGEVGHHDVHDESLVELPAEVMGEVAMLASVAAPAVQTRLLLELAKRFARVSLARSSARHGRLQIAYAEPDRLGVDRFLALLALSRDACPSLLVSVGTALTIDVLAADGRHCGGVIAPSPTLMRQALHGRVPQLPQAGGEHQDFADNTEDALASGCIGAAQSLIAQRLDRAEALLGARPALWLHGGGAAELLANLPEARISAHPVLQGLACYLLDNPG